MDYRSEHVASTFSEGKKLSTLYLLNEMRVNGGLSNVMEDFNKLHHRKRFVVFLLQHLNVFLTVLLL